ncbi:MAG: TIGR01212 family radical SAM protein, partial [Victivallales bacterium]|nr:TIGR01212 family radical SAM protein [Victivallales bacterium]
MLLFKDFILQKHRKPLYRVPLSLAIPCPHRVGNKGRGCLFCPENGAQARHIRHSMDLPEQVENGIAFVRRRYGKDCGLIAYLQSFTNTNDSAENLEKVYSQILGLADFEMLIISTRPDCLPDDVLDYLQKLNSKHDLWIEIGVQTANDRTLELMNRQHTFGDVEDAVRELHARGIKSAAHVILGLPGEDTADFRDTAAKISRLPFSAMKIHNLLILKNTPMASIYHRQRKKMPTDIPEIRPLNEYEYAEILADFIRHIPEDWPLMRVMTDAPKEDIIAPKWWMKKGQFLEFLKNKLAADDTNSLLPEVMTADGSKTLYHPTYRQHFHSLAGAVSEAKNKFIAPCKIRKLLKTRKTVRILDIGFGLGVNALEAAKLANNVRAGRLVITSLEKDIKTIHIAAQKSPQNHALANLAKTLHHKDKFSEIRIIPGDARETLGKIKTKFHAVFLDPFSH